MSKVRHVLGISGGKDSAALAIYMKQYFECLIVYERCKISILIFLRR